MKDGLLVANGGKANAVSRDEFSDFELVAEWRLAAKGNSGIYYRADAALGHALGTEYQIGDNSGLPRGKMDDDKKMGSLSGVLAPKEPVQYSPGTWSTTKIVCNGTNVEHWLNGVKLFSYDTAFPAWQDIIRTSSIGTDAAAQVVTRRSGHILLQSVLGDIAFRSVRIRELSPSVALSAGERVNRNPAEIDATPKASPESESVDDTAELRQSLLNHEWHDHDSLYGKGDACVFRPDGTFHKWRWNYWVVGPREIRVHYDKKNKNVETAISMMFNDDLTQFTGSLGGSNGKKKNVITGTRKGVIKN